MRVVSSVTHRVEGESQCLCSQNLAYRTHKMTVRRKFAWMVESLELLYRTINPRDRFR